MKRNVFIEHKRDSKKILLTPIECNKRYKTIKLVNGEICSPQKYYCGEDCDMSDFAVGFMK